MTQPQSSRPLLATLEAASTVTRELLDEYIFTEHLLIGPVKGNTPGFTPIMARILADVGAIPEVLIGALPQVYGSLRATSAGPESTYKTLEKYGIDFTEATREDRLDPVIGCDIEVRHAVQILPRRTKNNLVLIGEPGVGRTAVAEDLAQHIVTSDVPGSLRGKHLISLNLSGMVAGAKYRGEFEERLKAVLEETKSSDGEVVALIDELHTVVGVGGGSEGTMNAGNMLEPTLARGELCMVSATTLDKHRENIEKDPTLERRLQQVFVGKPSVESTMTILHGIASECEVHHQVIISDGAFVAVVALSNRYVTGHRLPDKTISPVDEAVSRLCMKLDSSPVEIDELRHYADRIRTEEAYLDESIEDIPKADPADVDYLERLRVELADTSEELASFNAHQEAKKAGHNKVGKLRTALDEMRTRADLTEREGSFEEADCLRYGGMSTLERQIREIEAASDAAEQAVGEPMIVKKVGAPEITEIVGPWTGIPVDRLLRGETGKSLTMGDIIGERLIGQEAVVTVMADAVCRSRVGISDPDRPTGSFLSLDPTGVDKTELARALAKFLFNDECIIVHIDMPEYSGKRSVACLAGAPSGYVGYEEGGQPTGAVRRRPYSVVPFDEVEKAHPEVFDIPLQVLDDGRLTDGQERTVNFRNVVLALTSSPGGQFLADPLTSPEKERNGVMSVVQTLFEPRLLNRLDDTITFGTPSKEELGGIVGIQLTRIAKCLTDRRLSPEVTDAARSQLADKGHDPACGARPLCRLIQREIGDRLAHTLLVGGVLDGQEVVVDKVGGSEGLTLRAEGETHLSSVSSTASPA